MTTLELDIGLSADGVVVVSHDTALTPDHTRDAAGQWLAPANGRSGPTIRSLTLAQLQGYDVGRPQSLEQLRHASSRCSCRATANAFPTLAAVFDPVRARGPAAATVRFNIETKIDPTRPDETAAPEPMVRALLAVIDKARMAERVTVQSFDWRTLALVGQLGARDVRAPT